MSDGTGLYTFRGRLIDLALRRLKEPKPSPAETMLCLRLGSERIAEHLTRAEAEELVAERAADALAALLARGEGYPVHLVVCAPTAVFVDPRDGIVTGIHAVDERGEYSVIVRVHEPTVAVDARGLRRRASD